MVLGLLGVLSILGRRREVLRLGGVRRAIEALAMAIPAGGPALPAAVVGG